jgi:hypothetical protein
MHCLVLAVHGLRPDFFGCYGNDWIDTPNLDRLASESVLFDQHFANVPDPTGACRTWQTPDTDLLQLLSTAEVDTRLVGNSVQRPPDSFTGAFQKSRFVTGGPKPGACLESVLDAARKASSSLARRKHALLWVDVPVLLPPWNIPAEFLELYFPSEYDPPDDDEEKGQDDALLTPWTAALPPVVAADDATLLRLRRTYAAAVSHFDSHLGSLLDSVVENEDVTDWLLALTAPFGLPLGDHGITGMHRPWLHDELIHVPLVIRLPGAAEAGRRVCGLTQPIDLLVTLLEAFGVPDPSAPSHSLMPLCRGEVETIRTEAFSALGTADAEEWALRTPEWAFLLPAKVPPSDLPRGPHLYVKPEDRFEVNNVVQHHLELAEGMERRLREMMTE